MGEEGWGRGVWTPKGTTRSAPVHRLLFLKLKAQNEREKFAFCSVKGCERIKIKALLPKNAGVSNCAATAYPKFAERAVVDVPMPKKLFASQLVSGRQRARALRGGPDPISVLSRHLLRSLDRLP